MEMNEKKGIKSRQKGVKRSEAQRTERKLIGKYSNAHAC